MSDHVLVISPEVSSNNTIQKQLRSKPPANQQHPREVLAMGGTTAAWQAGAGTPTGVSGGQCVLGCVLVGGAMRSAYDTRIAYCALRSAYCVLGNYAWHGPKPSTLCFVAAKVVPGMPGIPLIGPISHDLADSSRGHLPSHLQACWHSDRLRSVMDMTPP
jgi:hypothetical protein